MSIFLVCCLLVFKFHRRAFKVVIKKQPGDRSSFTLSWPFVVVFYDGDVVLAGATIDEAINYGVELHTEILKKDK